MNKIWEEINRMKGLSFDSSLFNNNKVKILYRKK